MSKPPAGDVWLPGSFTKNFSWGRGNGLRVLHEHIRVGFDSKLEAVPRDLYRERVAHIPRPDLVATNFFLFNKVIEGVNHLVVDELVFQAITAEHSRRFDHLAIFAFNYSRAGTWKGAEAGHRYPALWAQNYVLQRVVRDFDWHVRRINARDIENFVSGSPQYKARSAKKISTNLSFFYDVGNFDGFREPRIDRWWVDALFLALDRLIGDEEIDGKIVNPSELPKLLLRSRFPELSGPVTPEKTFAMAHLLGLYSICGDIRRFDNDRVRELTTVEIPDYNWQIANDDRPPGALHPTNPRILKTIPRDCARLAQRAGFQIIYPDDLETFDPKEFIVRRSNDAMSNLQAQGIKSSLTAEELHKLTRGE